MMIFHKTYRVIIGVLLVGATALTACSVKEEREPCPAFLSVSFPDKESIRKPVTLLGYNTEEVFRSRVNVSALEDDWLKAVRKSRFNLSAYCGVDRNEEREHFILIPIGTECDSLYSFQTDVDCTGDVAHAEVKLHKQFSTVSVDLNKPLEGENSIDRYRFLVEGKTCGFDLMSYEPVAGTYRIEPAVRRGETVVYFRIPRQNDSSMILTIWYLTDDGLRLPLEEFSLGEYMRKIGYDWKEEDLKDIDVKIDIISGFITIEVEGWEEGYTFSFIEQ